MPSQGRRSDDPLLSEADTDLSRRKYMAVAALLGGSVTAGCMGEDDVGADDSDDTTDPSDDDDDLDETPQHGGELVTTIDSPISHFDHHVDGLMVAHAVGYNITEKLFRANYDLELYPFLADDVVLSNDGLTWEIQLMEGVQYHPPYQRELVADDIKWNLERVLDPETGSDNRYGMNVIEEMTVLDDYTLELELSRQRMSMEAWLGGYFGTVMFSPDAIEDGMSPREHPVGTGPFVFEEWEPDDRIVVSRFDDYWDGDKPYVDQVTFRPLTEPSVMITEIEQGDIHMLRATPVDFIGQLEDNDELTVQTVDSPGYRSILINPNDHPTEHRAEGTPTTDRYVRQAILEAIDREAMVEIVEGGNAALSQTFFPESSPFHVDYAPYSMEADVEAANDLLEQSEFETPVPIEIASTPGDPTLNQLGTIVRDALDAANFDPNLNNLEIGSWSERANGLTYDVLTNYYGGWSHPAEIEGFLDPDGMQHVDISQVEDSDRIFELFSEIDQTNDQDEVDALNTELQERLVDSATKVPLYLQRRVETHRNEVRNHTTHPSQIRYDMAELWLDQ